MCDVADTNTTGTLVTHQARASYPTASLATRRQQQKPDIQHQQLFSDLIHVDADVVKGLCLARVYGRDR